MRKLITFGFLLVSVFAGAQITVDNTDMPVMNDSFRISLSATIGAQDPALTDTNYFWNFSDLSATSQRVDRYVGVGTTPLGYQLFFNNGITYPSHFSSYAVAGQDFSLGTIAVEKVFNFYKNSSTEYSHTGFGAEIQGLPASVRNVPVDRLYAFPLNYQNTDSTYSEFGIPVPGLGYYGQRYYRLDTVDGWGTVQTPFGTFNALRVKSTVYRTDTTYITATSGGFTFPRQPEVEYKWLAKGMGIPVVEIIDRQGTYEIEYLDSVRAVPQVAVEERPNQLMDFRISPNPARGLFVYKYDLTDGADVELKLYDLTGKVILNRTEKGTRGANMNFITLPRFLVSPGLYLVEITVGRARHVEKLQVID